MSNNIVFSASSFRPSSSISVASPPHKNRRDRPSTTSTHTYTHAAHKHKSQPKNRERDPIFIYAPHPPQQQKYTQQIKYTRHTHKIIGARNVQIAGFNTRGQVKLYRKKEEVSGTRYTNGEWLYPKPVEWRIGMSSEITESQNGYISLDVRIRDEETIPQESEGSETKIQHDEDIQRIADLNAAIYQTPTDKLLWQQLLALQHRKHHDKRMAIADKAIAAMTDQDAIVEFKIKRLKIGSEIWQDQQLDEEYEYLLTDYPEMPSLWQAYFDDRIDIKSLEEQLELYKNAIRDTQGSRRFINSEFQSIYKTKDCAILVRFSKMLLERGYSERVFSIWSLINRLKYEYKEEDGSWREWARRNTVTLEVPDEWLAAEDSVMDDETITPDLRWFRLESLREYRDWCAEGADLQDLDDVDRVVSFDSHIAPYLIAPSHLKSVDVFHEFMTLLGAGTHESGRVALSSITDSDDFPSRFNVQMTSWIDGQMHSRFAEVPDMIRNLECSRRQKFLEAIIRTTYPVPNMLCEYVETLWKYSPALAYKICEQYLTGDMIFVPLWRLYGRLKGQEVGPVAQKAILDRALNALQPSNDMQVDWRSNIAPLFEDLLTLCREEGDEAKMDELLAILVCANADIDHKKPTVQLRVRKYFTSSANMHNNASLLYCQWIYRYLHPEIEMTDITRTQWPVQKAYVKYLRHSIARGGPYKPETVRNEAEALMKMQPNDYEALSHWLEAEKQCGGRVSNRVGSWLQDRILDHGTPTDFEMAVIDLYATQPAGTTPTARALRKLLQMCSETRCNRTLSMWIFWICLEYSEYIKGGSHSTQGHQLRIVHTRAMQYCAHCKLLYMIPFHPKIGSIFTDRERREMIRLMEARSIRIRVLYEEAGGSLVEPKLEVAEAVDENSDSDGEIALGLELGISSGVKRGVRFKTEKPISQHI